MRTSLSLLALSAFVPAFGQVNIDFEELGTQPSLFLDTTALRDQLSAEGARFATVAGPNDGPAILNQAGSFGFNARSGEQFLAYNSGANYANGGFAISGVRINFSAVYSTVQIYSASTFGGTSTMRAFNSSNVQVGSASVNDSANWQALTVNANGIAYVTLDSTNTFGAFDDLTAVPEPATMAVLGLGLAAIARRRKA